MLGMSRSLRPPWFGWTFPLFSSAIAALTDSRWEGLTVGLDLVSPQLPAGVRSQCVADTFSS